MRSEALFWAALVCAIALFLAGIASSGSNGGPQQEATNILLQEGITNVTTDGLFWPFGCAKDDQFQVRFHGIKNGAQVEGIVCGGMFKGWTVRYFGH